MPGTRACLMGSRVAAVLACLLAACGNGSTAAAPPRETGASGFRRWPADTTVAVRLPAPAAVAARPEAFAALLRAVGRERPSAFLFGADTTEGVTAAAPAWAALTASGAWLRALPVSDMALARRSFADLPREVVAQETDGFLVLFHGTMPGQGEEPALPEGDLALRVRHHPLLATVAESGDVLEIGLQLGTGGLDARGRLLPGPGSPTTGLLARAVAGQGGLAEFFPPGLFLRVETTLPPVSVAAALARRLARHLGFTEEKDRTTVERFLREALTGADPEAGLAIGCEARGGELTLVLIARDGEGPTSPILQKVRSDERSSFGPVVLDRRDDVPKGLAGWYAWIAQATPEIEDLPECLWGAAAALADESKGVMVAYAAFDGWSVVGVGPRADTLARATKSRLQGGTARSPGAEELRRLREEGREYVLGVVVEPGAADLPAADLAALGAAFGGVEGARGPKAAAVAGFRSGAGLDLRIRVLY